MEGVRRRVRASAQVEKMSNNTAPNLISRRALEDAGGLILASATQGAQCRLLLLRACSRISSHPDCEELRAIASVLQEAIERISRIRRGVERKGSEDFALPLTEGNQ